MSSTIAALLVSFMASFATASSGAVFRPGTWYETLERPSWTPPNAAFPIVWTILFTAMAVAAWLVWQSGGIGAWPVLALYAAHLLVNALWSYLFFGLRRLDLALADVVLLFVMIATLIAGFLSHSTLAAILLVPYLAWVSVAAALNLRLLQLNGTRGQDGSAP